MTAILHVEEDEFLASAVEGAFESFGFVGTFLTAATLTEAATIIRDDGQPLDLILADMELRDGTGLDVVRLVRSDPAHEHVPILILAARADDAAVDRAYALGVNTYTTTSARGRNPAEVLRTIYDYWLRDARVPGAAGLGRTHGVIARAMSIRSRVAEQYMRIAEQRGAHDGDFWMDVAQREGNLANLLMFLVRQLGNRVLPSELLADLEAHQKETLRVLDELTGIQSITEDDAFKFLFALTVPTDTPAFAHVVALLFPSFPVAIAALLDSLARSLETTSSEIEAHASDPVLRARAAELRERATLLGRPE
jgi:CheY-like chemotaxis protein